MEATAACRGETNRASTLWAVRKTEATFLQAIEQFSTCVVSLPQWAQTRTYLSAALVIGTAPAWNVRMSGSEYAADRRSATSVGGPPSR
jgi:hypothetical protein